MKTKILSFLMFIGLWTSFEAFARNPKLAEATLRMSSEPGCKTARLERPTPFFEIELIISTWENEKFVQKFLKGNTYKELFGEQNFSNQESHTLVRDQALDLFPSSKVILKIIANQNKIIIKLEHPASNHGPDFLKTIWQSIVQGMNQRQFEYFFDAIFTESIGSTFGLIFGAIANQICNVPFPLATISIYAFYRMGHFAQNNILPHHSNDEFLYPNFVNKILPNSINGHFGYLVGSLLGSAANLGFPQAILASIGCSHFFEYVNMSSLLFPEETDFPSENNTPKARSTEL